VRTLPFKNLGSVRFKMHEIDKVNVKTFVMLQNISISDKCSFEVSFHQSILKKNVLRLVSTKLLSSTTVFNIDRNNKSFLSSKSSY